MSDTVHTLAYDQRHGSPYDRGSADSYYGRSYEPHYFTGATYSTDKVELADMTPEEIAAYTRGYNDNEASSNFKEW
jgi:hypothetical protein